jgi:hypothetical protein
MSQAFDAYTSAVDRMSSAEQRGNAVVQALSRAIGPLFSFHTSAGTMPAWKTLYLTGLDNQVPAVLVRRAGPGSGRNPLNVGSVQADFVQLQSIMVEYADAELTAFEAYQQIPPQEQAQMIRPPWQAR